MKVTGLALLAVCGVSAISGVNWGNMEHPRVEGHSLPVLSPNVVTSSGFGSSAASSPDANRIAHLFAAEPASAAAARQLDEDGLEVSENSLFGGGSVSQGQKLGMLTQLLAREPAAAKITEDPLGLDGIL
eukprot:CAMPEP_0175142310 /NCGR_PEP_ID=MMETSP0087-20121206/12717_1 /TAXON_ID=136419 /ORGANISM="Unknown Unknown, Strain D1" /LENGTH=129 /DNA_ID=CAMNT_0016426077 /DNA_START=50 /DNA_END=439 /DNA_ORIENTATION=-